MSCDYCHVISTCRYHGVESLQAALTQHLLARAQSFLGDFRAALTHEKITFSIYKKKVRVFLYLVCKDE